MAADYSRGCKRLRKRGQVKKHSSKPYLDLAGSILDPPAAPAAAEPRAENPLLYTGINWIDRDGSKHEWPCDSHHGMTIHAPGMEHAGTATEIIAGADYKFVPLTEPVPQSEPPLPRCIYCANPGMYTLSHLGKHFDIRGQEHACLLAAPSPAETSQASAMRKALEFYARHEHWMTLGEQPGSQHKILVANGDTDSVEGWAMAEKALAGPGDAKEPKR